MEKFTVTQFNGENVVLSAEAFDRIYALAEQVKDWERRSESCESKLGQLEANELVMELRQEIKRLEKTLQKPDCSTCANRGEIDGLSQEFHCHHCTYGYAWLTDHYVRRKEK